MTCIMTSEVATDLERARCERIVLWWINETRTLPVTVILELIQSGNEPPKTWIEPHLPGKPTYPLEKS